MFVAGNPQADRNDKPAQRRGLAEVPDAPKQSQKHLLAEIMSMLAEAEEPSKVPDHHGRIELPCLRRCPRITRQQRSGERLVVRATRFSVVHFVSAVSSGGHEVRHS